MDKKYFVTQTNFGFSGPSEARDVKHTSAVKSRGTRDGGPEPPHTEARLHGWLFIVNIALNTLRTSPETHARRVPPQAPFSVTYRNNKKAVEYKPVRA